MFEDSKNIEKGVHLDMTGDRIESWLLAFHEWGEKKTTLPTRHGGSFVALCDKYRMNSLISIFKKSITSLDPRYNTCVLTVAAKTDLFKDVEEVIMLWVADCCVSDFIIHSLPKPFIIQCMQRGKQENERKINHMRIEHRAAIASYGRGFGANLNNQPQVFGAKRKKYGTFG
jgi:hypothetical protein